MMVALQIKFNYFHVVFLLNFLLWFVFNIGQKREIGATCWPRFVCTSLILMLFPIWQESTGFLYIKTGDRVNLPPSVYFFIRAECHSMKFALFCYLVCVLEPAGDIEVKVVIDKLYFVKLVFTQVPWAVNSKKFS